METKTTKGRSVTLGLRTTQETKDRLIELAELMGEKLGTRVTQTQALEVAVMEALNARKGTA